MVAGPTSVDPFESLANRIKDLEAALEEQGRRSIPDTTVPLYPLFVSALSATDVGFPLAVRAFTNERDIWEGRIGDVWHPFLYVDGTWGWALSGTLPVSVTYRLYVNNVFKGSWTHAAPGGVATVNQGPFDISEVLRGQNVGVRITGQCTNGAADNAYYAGILGCHQRRQ